MTATLFIGDYIYSSWSLRGWLFFERFGLAVRTKRVPFDQGSVADHMTALAPARTVPAMVTEDGAVVWDSLAIAEELASRFPEAGLWPQDPRLRALARSLAAEMHSGIADLRNDCPMNLRTAYTGVRPSTAVRADVARIAALWDHALTQSGGPWLCGGYSVADAVYAPVAARIAGYGLPVDEPAQAYVARHLADPAFRCWRAMGLAGGATLQRYQRDHSPAPWPGPEPLTAAPVESGTPENDACPYSGKPVTHLARIEGRVFGFCNAFCRDKTVADAAAWPAFMALFDQVTRA
ncbi:glutathione S-transferase [Aestuariicoccus sp. MJ-SS9]|uniref:glutathione S-transferase n=1 Tax=Aestuariicoccus sp. MJ-SS9 TaxID=3079855 RepID=UPI002910F2E5|nr:glutathione S-transferase [Aestuariicoccus sp. MJ-SS9]MDU8909649.1 glutathione S-transferase [Aestuariicoccus sp. MJ-SS9]